MHEDRIKPRLTSEENNMRSNVTMFVQISLIHLPVAASESFLSLISPSSWLSPEQNEGAGI